MKEVIIGGDYLTHSGSWYTLTGKLENLDGDYAQSKFLATTSHTLECTISNFSLENALDSPDIRLLVRSYTTASSFAYYIKWKIGSGSFCAGHQVNDVGVPVFADDLVALTCTHLSPTLDDLRTETLTLQISFTTTSTTDELFVDAMGIEVDYSALQYTDFKFNMYDYKPISLKPLQKVIRAYFTNSNSIEDHYTKDEIHSFDFILEDGKKSITIVPQSSTKQLYAVGLLFSYFNSAEFDIMISNLQYIGCAGLETEQINTIDKVPMVLALNSEENKIVGLGTNQWDVDHGKLDSDYLNYISFRENTKTNDKLLYTFFANKYYKPDGTDLTIFGNQSGYTVSDGEPAYGGVALRSTSQKTVVLGNLKLGHYKVICRVRSQSVTSSMRVEVRSDVAVSHARTDYVSVPPSIWTYIETTFFVDRETDTMEIDVEQIGSANTLFDFYILLPLTNGKDFISDLYLQGLSISNNKYVGQA